jgi:hypothetical protein
VPEQERAMHVPPPTGCRSVAFMAQAPRRGPKRSRPPPEPHGRETLEARRKRVEAMARIRAVVDLAVDFGILKRRITGRKGDPL